MVYAIISFSVLLFVDRISIPVALFQAVMDKSCSRVLFCALWLLAVVLLTNTHAQSVNLGPFESFSEAADFAAQIAVCSKPTSHSSLLANTTRLPDEYKGQARDRDKAISNFKLM